MATIIRQETIQLQETPGSNFTSGLATPSRGATEVSIILQQQAPGGQNPLHYHDREEVVMLRAGSITVTIGEERIALAAGDTLIVPARGVHQIENTGDERAEWLLVAPAGVRFFGPTGEEARPAFAL